MTKEELIKMYSPFIKDIHPAGYSLIGRCPFHRERTGSFILNHNLGYYHCFGCGKSGQLSDLMDEIIKHRQKKKGKQNGNKQP